ncbi:hypothetical protein C0Z18_13035 [Trinickia dabaoshanensis]|jgi:hypothetical protein|uniref:Uncharacterized protein n=1 Tax=Trinickia dabaoshanensis TaxID=564714 RepID=A0A2N7VRG8_9BURK|nr:hypothetical protein [Trinickia dabaoshanensis]PMS19749.1 hypothetical protein C0Z18_13035 [Trinickia dabaoshanensis]TAM51876.1 MAG: hypothetical protein EPN57_15805 [Paraburkholderia sp.]
MKRLLVSLIAALVLAFPIAIAIGRNPWFGRWMAYGHGWDAFDPLLNFFGVVGVEGEGDVVVNTLLIVSFVLSFALAWFIFGAVKRIRQRKAQ